MKSNKQVKLVGNGAALIPRFFLAVFFGKGSSISYRSKDLLISLQNIVAKKSDAVYAMCLQPVFLNKTKYHPVRVK